MESLRGSAGIRQRTIFCEKCIIYAVTTEQRREKEKRRQRSIACILLRVIPGKAFLLGIWLRF